MDFDHCIKVADEPTIFMARDDSMSKVAIEHWEDYVALGKPDCALVSKEEADRFRTVKYFRPARRS